MTTLTPYHISIIAESFAELRRPGLLRPKHPDANDKNNTKNLVNERRKLLIELNNLFDHHDLVDKLSEYFLNYTLAPKVHKASEFNILFSSYILLF
jgi:hypothetical protein